METINNIELTNKEIYPDETVLEAVLGESYSSLVKLLELFDSNEMTHEWKYYNDGKAWLCKVQKKKKTIVWMSAWKGFMKATIYVPLRLLDDVLALDIENVVKEHISGTKNVGKSKPCTFEVRDDGVLIDFEKVMLFKINVK